MRDEQKFVQVTFQREPWRVDNELLSGTVHHTYKACNIRRNGIDTKKLLSMITSSFRVEHNFSVEKKNLFIFPIMDKEIRHTINSNLLQKIG